MNEFALFDVPFVPAGILLNAAQSAA